MKALADVMPLPSTDAIATRLRVTLVGLVEGLTTPVSEVDPDIRQHLDALVTKPEHTVRDGLLTLLAMEVEHGQVIDWQTQPLHNPARGASRYLGSELYPDLHIVGSREALQTGVKGVSRYVDRNNATWRAVLTWAAAQTDVRSIEAAYLYLASRVAATARMLPPMPALDTPRLTFLRVFSLMDDLLAHPSGGAYEQFIFAALLEAWREQLNEPGVVETKHINASDASAGTAADVQERYKGQVTEAYEVTADDYRSKIAQAQATLQRHDLRRVHIVSRNAATAAVDEMVSAMDVDLDISVLDVREEIRSLTARLSKPFRRHALVRVYDLLVSKQPNDTLVQIFVGALVNRGITQAP